MLLCTQGRFPNDNILVCDEYYFETQIQIDLGVLKICKKKKKKKNGLKFFGDYKYEYIWIPFFRQIQIQINLGLPKWANMNTNTTILTDIFYCEYEYKYNHTKQLDGVGPVDNKPPTN